MGDISQMKLVLLMYSSPCFSHGVAAEAETAVQRKRGEQKASAAQSTVGGKARTHTHPMHTQSSTHQHSVVSAESEQLCT